MCYVALCFSKKTIIFVVLHHITEAKPFNISSVSEVTKGPAPYLNHDGSADGGAVLSRVASTQFESRQAAAMRLAEVAECQAT
ncbi:hypothetical protein D3C73_1377720 [compost metagenome]